MSHIAQKVVKINPAIVEEVVVTLAIVYPNFMPLISPDEVGVILEMVEDSDTQLVDIQAEDGNILSAILQHFR